MSTRWEAALPSLAAIILAALLALTAGGFGLMIADVIRQGRVGARPKAVWRLALGLLLVGVGMAGVGAVGLAAGGVPGAPRPGRPAPAATQEGMMTARTDPLALALVDAAARGDVRRVEAVLASGAPIDARDARGRTPILAATHGHHADAVAAVLRAGADVHVRDDLLDNPLLYAGAEGDLAIVQFVVAAGADPTRTNRVGGTALIPAAERGHVEVVRALLTETAVDVNHVNRLGWTALLEAVILGDGGARHQAIVDLLIAHGADVDLADRDGVTPLAHARARGYRPIEALLTAAGARA